MTEVCLDIPLVEIEVLPTVIEMEVSPSVISLEIAPCQNVSYTINGSSSSDVFLTAQGITKYLVVSNSPSGIIPTDINNLATAWNILGISVETAGSGSSLEVKFEGLISEPTWNWDLDKPIFCGVGGVLTQYPPETPPTKFLCQVANPITPIQIFINIQDVIQFL